MVVIDSFYPGSDAAEIMVVSTLAPMSLLFLGLENTSSKQRPSSSVKEYLYLVIPLLLSVTIGSFHPFHLWLLLASFLATKALLKFYHKGQSSQTKDSHDDVELSDESGKLSFLTNYRSSMLLVTSLCILAVDFRVFPRKYAKTLTYGYGLMDVGVGSYVFSAGVVHSRANKSCSLFSTVKKALPLLLLGLGRVIATRAVGYHEQIAEYGLHWNFFFTLGVVQVVSSTLLSLLVPVELTWAASIGVGVAYECWLTYGEMADWALELQNDRSHLSFVSANREGIVSTIGFVSVYFAGVSIGQSLRKLAVETKLNVHIRHLKRTGAWCVLLWSLLYTLSSQHEFFMPSRRLANSPYIIWMIAYNLTLLGLFHLCDVLIAVWREHKGYSPVIFTAISYNPLPYFLLANVTTGMVNLTADPWSLSPMTAIVILAVYMAFVNTVALVMFDKKLKLI